MDYEILQLVPARESDQAVYQCSKNPKNATLKRVVAWALVKQQGRSCLVGMVVSGAEIRLAQEAAPGGYEFISYRDWQ